MTNLPILRQILTSKNESEPIFPCSTVKNKFLYLEDIYSWNEWADSKVQKHHQYTFYGKPSIFIFNIMLRVLVFYQKQNVWAFNTFWRRPLSWRNQSIDLLCKSMDWFLHGNGLRHERVNIIWGVTMKAVTFES